MGLDLGKELVEVGGPLGHAGFRDGGDGEGGAEEAEGEGGGEELHCCGGLSSICLAKRVRRGEGMVRM